jgi:prolyl-tRNA editing enzyme YbaK/EbsC (Cys-tRNA(Pro) deacylase)
VSVEAVRDHLRAFGLDAAMVVLAQTSATVATAAEALGVQPGLIAKTVAVYAADADGALLVVTAGDARLANGPFKRRFGWKPRLLRVEDVEAMTGHPPGGVCPFGNPPGVDVWLDESLRRFERVWPAAGDQRSAVGMTLTELERASGSRGWVDVTTGWRDPPVGDG